jgi:channel protein (hemolysin III family)
VSEAPYPLPGFSDPVSSLSHLLGAGFFACLTPFLLRRGRGHAGRLFCLSVFAFSTVLLLSVSGVYHLLTRGEGGRAVLLRLDHGAIFVLIAGTFTPLYGVLFRGLGRWLPLLFVWSVAIAGLTLKTIFFKEFSATVTVSLYLGLGWFGAVAGYILWQRHGVSFILPLLWGGVAYSVGAMQDYLGDRYPWWYIFRIVGPHELFHMFVLLGVGCHWWFVFRLTDGIPPLWSDAGKSTVATPDQERPAGL